MIPVPANANFNPNTMDMWVVYDRPSDYPDYILARRWKISANGPTATQEIITFDTLGACRDAFQGAGYVRLGRSAIDDETIIETWL